MAGIEASTMMSLGTCRLVMPLSESTIARAGPWAEPLLDGRLDGLAVRERVGCCRSGRRGRRWGDAGCGSWSPYSGRRPGSTPHRVAEHDRVGDLHHGGLEVHREQHASALALAICSVRTRAGASTSMKVASMTSPARTWTPSLSTVTVPSSATCSMRSVSASAITTDCSLRRKSPLAHGGDVGLGVGCPRAHRVRVLAGVLLDGVGRAPVGVALAQHGVDGAALHLVVAGRTRARRRSSGPRGSRGSASPATAAP